MSASFHISIYLLLLLLFSPLFLLFRIQTRIVVCVPISAAAVAAAAADDAKEGKTKKKKKNPFRKFFTFSFFSDPINISPLSSFHYNSLFF